VWTVEGIQIDRSDEHQENPASPRRETREGGSNVKYKSFLQSLKECFGMVSIDDGMQID
jgi:hypothetical protein